MILDTNILVHLIRKQLTPPQDSFLTIITVGEIKSLSQQFDWGKSKIDILEDYISEFPILNISYEMTDLYAYIDVYSQGKHKNLLLPKGITARNMGKNDLWIATIAMFYQEELCTTDNDFEHLIQIGLKLKKSL
ncbi:MAG: type II toxin-antitoxin system VapC family toxin [Spirosomaceae bacterium]|jgi:predicted nucleic acid-binding protein|nr:type II toxin-antitoxin system VapC family toxin [Spirosomataceae bacterium]